MACDIKHNRCQIVVMLFFHFTSFVCVCKKTQIVACTFLIWSRPSIGRILREQKPRRTRSQHTAVYRSCIPCVLSERSEKSSTTCRNVTTQYISSSSAHCRSLVCSFSWASHFQGYGWMNYDSHHFTVIYNCFFHLLRISLNQRCSCDLFALSSWIAKWKACTISNYQTTFGEREENRMHLSRNKEVYQQHYPTLFPFAESIFTMKNQVLRQKRMSIHHWHHVQIGSAGVANAIVQAIRLQSEIPTKVIVACENKSALSILAFFSLRCVRSDMRLCSLMKWKSVG